MIGIAGSFQSDPRYKDGRKRRRVFTRRLFLRDRAGLSNRDGKGPARSYPHHATTRTNLKLGKSLASLILVRVHVSRIAGCNEAGTEGGSDVSRRTGDTPSVRPRRFLLLVRTMRAGGRGMYRPPWNGSISFGLVNIPVDLYPARIAIVVI